MFCERNAKRASQRTAQAESGGDAPAGNEEDQILNPVAVQHLEPREMPLEFDRAAWAAQNDRFRKKRSRLCGTYKAWPVGDVNCSSHEHSASPGDGERRVQDSWRQVGSQAECQSSQRRSWSIRQHPP
eukprot:6080091-Pyramimonas_sp.AAC.1